MKNTQPKSQVNSEMYMHSSKVDIYNFFSVSKFFDSLMKGGFVGLLFLGSIAPVFGQTQTFSASGNFTVPNGVTKVTVHVWGAGGAGGGVTNGANSAGGGGAGGSYTKGAGVSVSSGQVIAVTVGAGGLGANDVDGPSGGTSTFASGVPVSAIGGAGGKKGTDASDQTGAGAPLTVGTPFNGGAGGEAAPVGTTGTDATSAGGGGGSPGTGGSGGSASTATGGTAGAGGGGAGPNGTGTNGNGATAVNMGAGGAGGFQNTSNNKTGGDGAGGQVIVTWVAPFVVTVAPTGSPVIPGRWFPLTNTGINYTVAVPNDAALTGGTIQLQGRVSSGSYGPVGTTHPIVVGDLGNNVVLSLSKAQFEAISGYGIGLYMQVQAIITGSTGDTQTGTSNATDIFVQGATETGVLFSSTAASWTVPAGVNSVTVEAWGGGGGGGNSNNGTGNGGGGGGGGSYSKSVVPVVPGATPGVTVGTGGAGGPASSGTNAVAGSDSSFPTVSPVIIAKGGSFGIKAGIGGAGGVAGTGTTTRLGGNGGNSDGNAGGGGGSSAGTLAIGVAGTATSSNTIIALGASAPLGGGNGGDNSVSNAAAQAGSVPGGGGGGSNDVAASAGGAGADGQVIITYSIPTIVSILNSVNPIKPPGALTQTVAVKFSESMNTAGGFTPLIQISGSNWGLQTGGAWTSAPLTNDTYTATLTHNGTSEYNTAAVSTVSLTPTPPRSASGNDMVATTSSAVFTIDTQPPTAPTVGSVTTNTGGVVVAGYYNKSNETNSAGITIPVTLPSDVTLPSGTIQIQWSNGGSYIDLGLPVSIPTAGVTQNVIIAQASLTGNTYYATGNTNSFKAKITDVNGNTSPLSAASGTTLIVDLAPPVITFTLKELVFPVA